MLTSKLTYTVIRPRDTTLGEVENLIWTASGFLIVYLRGDEEYQSDIQFSFGRLTRALRKSSRGAEDKNTRNAAWEGHVCKIGGTGLAMSRSTWNF